MKIEIIKIGGNVIDAPEALDKFLRSFTEVDGAKVLVHGGGKLATRLSERLGIETKMIDGRRVTDDDTINVVTMVYGGLTNKHIVARLQSLNCPSIGLSGADGDLIPARLRPKVPVDFGWVGDPDSADINVPLLQNLLSMGITPVVCALTHDREGHLLNTNADTIASSIAVALAGENEVNLTFCFEQKGVLRDISDPESIIPTITPETYAGLIADGTVSKGMLPKLKNAFDAIEKGVKSVIIKHANDINKQAGTTIKALPCPDKHVEMPAAPACFSPGKDEVGKAVELLSCLISTPSLSREEDKTATIIFDFLKANGILDVHRHKNNVWAKAATWDENKPTLLLNSHHDTVKPWTNGAFDPFVPTRQDGRIYGRGSNDAGASVVSLATAFIALYREVLPFNLLLSITSEEEITGPMGIRCLLPELPPIDMAIVGEPTLMQAAIAERGLMVLDGTSKGIAGHAARNEGVNALYRAIDDINILRAFKPEKTSSVLGPIKVSVTQIEAGTQHNVVPDSCHFVADIRTTDAYSNEETLAMLQSLVESNLKARSTHIRASVLAEDHPLAVTAREMGCRLYVSPTTSDMSQMPFPSIKMGPGDSARSHTVDEYVGEDEIAQAIPQYIRFVKSLGKHL
ncbi:MAG: acetylglutamate kinase [Prevotella sp.]|nr:acetylglutamate kinase [Prevotella sp.]